MTINKTNKLYHVSKTWGSEIWFANNDLYCGKELFIRKNCISSEGKFHYHKIKDETFYIIVGTLKLDYYNYSEDVESIILFSGDSFRILPLMRHRFAAMDGNCKFIEASTFHSDSDSYYEEIK